MGVEILGASFDTPEDNRAFAEKHGFPFRLLSDTAAEVGGQYEVRRPTEEGSSQLPLRVTYVIDPQGVIRQAYRVRDAGGHPEQVQADLEALTGGAEVPR